VTLIGVPESLLTVRLFPDIALIVPTAFAVAAVGEVCRFSCAEPAATTARLNKRSRKRLLVKDLLVVAIRNPDYIFGDIRAS